MTQQRVLIVEDEEALQIALCEQLEEQGFRTLQSESVAEAKRFLDVEGERIDLVMTDLGLPDGSGFDVMDHMHSLGLAARVLVITASQSSEHVIAALQRGAADFVVKPPEPAAVEAAVTRALRVNVRPRTSITPPPTPTPEELTRNAASESKFNGATIDAWRREFAPEILGKDTALDRVFAILQRVADTDCSVLITGESGTGKELIARSLHRASERSRSPFVTVNCAAIPANLVESELFGHTKGAFTGATSASPGRFMAADRGTLFLDEVGELPLMVQPKLLRALQQKEVTPVGDSRSHQVDVRVISATHRDLEGMAESGLFREDLLYRIHVIPVELPALRDRRGDIPLLIEHFVRKSNEKRRRGITGISNEALDLLSAYDWPGNVRQLENIVERMVILRSDGEISADDVPRKVRQGNGRSLTPTDAPVLPEQGLDLRDAVDRFESALIRQALERTGWNKNRAALILQMNRTTLVERLKKKGLENEK